MSPEHVAVMNEILEDNEAVRDQCALLEKPLTLGYELVDGPGGETVYWSMAFTDTVRFGLEQVDADLLFRGDWARVVRASKSGREGRQDDAGVVPVGDLEVLATVGPAFAVAQSIATVPVQFPEV
jgi:hypothetical protein